MMNDLYKNFNLSGCSCAHTHQLYAAGHADKSFTPLGSTLHGKVAQLGAQSIPQALLPPSLGANKHSRLSQC